MMQKMDAIAVRNHALAAITGLSAILKVVENKAGAEDYERLKKAVGLSIGRIQTDILDIINRDYPEPDDLK